MRNPMTLAQRTLFRITLREKAERWMDENPQVMELFRHFAQQMAERDMRFGIGALAERVRWECAVRTSGDTFKVNNNHRAYIARRLIEEDERLEKLLHVRATKD